MSVKMNGRHLAKFVADDEFDAIFPQVSLAHETLHGKTGPGSDFLGWVDLPVDYDKEEFARIKKAAAKIQSDSDVLVVIGIGGSYLGARAAIEALKGTLYNNTCKGTPQIFYVGNSISPAYLQSVLDPNPAPRPSRRWRSASLRPCWRKSTVRTERKAVFTPQRTRRAAR